MNDYSVRLANYWRNSLADAQGGSGALSAHQVKQFMGLPMAAWLEGRVPEDQLDALFAGETTGEPVAVTLRPWVYRSRLEHRKARQNRPEFVTPVICHVSVARDGRIHPTPQAWMARDLLEPLDRDSFALGAQTDLDAFLTANEVPQFEPEPATDRHAECWIEYRQFCSRMFSAVAGHWTAVEDGYDPADFCWIFKEDHVGGFSHNILDLYDHLSDRMPDVPLLDRFAQRDASPDEPCLPANSQFAERLAHAANHRALAPAQRDALAHLLVARPGDVLAVNGPPGTGKTSLLLSLIATLWARAALAGAEPPVIVASSTNNQAVTNIINAFGKDFSTGTGPLAGRWLPDIRSFGAYFPAASAEARSARDYQTKSFFTALESQAYLERAQPAYLARAGAAFAQDPPCSIQEVLERLQAAIRARQQQLAGIEQAWRKWGDARAVAAALLGDDPQAALAHLEEKHHARLEQRAQAHARLKKFEHFLAHESLFYTLLGWWPPVAQKRLRLAKLHCDESDSGLQGAASVVEIERDLVAALARADAACQLLQAECDTAHAALQAAQRQAQQWQAVAAVLATADKAADQVTLDDCDRWADTSLRFEIFLLATHYWEGRWLMEVTRSLPEILQSRSKRGRKALERNWRRWMKLTPCVVATFHRLPRELQCTRHDGSGFVDDYAYNFIDLLIVDEAGQVLPEVAAASFALARQALVIGDTQQTEPIWSVPQAVDVGNLRSAGLLAQGDAEEQYQALCERGHSAASGSVMAVAQSTSRYHYDQELARGMYLYEHYRCCDAIIGYCNTLCYKGRLLPRRESPSESGLPALGYLHIDGRCEQRGGSSRHNLLEAQVLAAWIKKHAAGLVDRYKKPLGEILGVVTPFGAQVRAIGQACAEMGIDAGKNAASITVGTVHSFQGAERPVMLFSAVYSKHADGLFIDRRNSLLNVAVSRARDSFLVFGDMDLFGQVPAGTPRGLLARHLFADAAHALEFELQPRADLQTARTGLSHLHEAPEHDAFLRKTLGGARQQVQIVTPWVRLRSMLASGLLDAMAETVQRGVCITVFTDLHFNTGIVNARPRGEPQKIEDFKAAMAALGERGIQVCVVSKVHSKIVMADDELLCIGSFNWLSAQRQGEHVHHETSMVYRGPDVRAELSSNRASLAQRVIPGEA